MKQLRSEVTLKRPKILIACEYSGIVRDAFIAEGYDAVSLDLLPSLSEGGATLDSRSSLYQLEEV